MQQAANKIIATGGSDGRGQTMNSFTLASIAGAVKPTFDAQKLRDFRKLAFLTLEGAAPLNSRNEDFKYTNFQAALMPLEKPRAIKGIDSVPSLSSYASKCVIVNGRFSPELSVIDEKMVRVIEASQELPTYFYDEKLLALEGKSSPLKLLSDATFSQLISIEVPKDESLEIEIININIAGDLDADGSKSINYVTPRILANVGFMANLTLVEHGVMYGDKPFFTNHNLEFILDEGANVEHIKIQRDNITSLNASTIYAKQLGKSIFKTVSINFGSNLTRNEVYPCISAENSEAWLIGANVISANQMVDNFTVIDHVAPNCESHELYKGMYGGKSKGVFSGTIIVRNEAQKTNAYQSNSSLLCSDDAESNSRPQLKIWADDVKCSHGATVGQLDEEALFYLKSRGIPESEARIMLTRAYVSEVFSHISDETLKSNVENLLEKKLQELL